MAEVQQRYSKPGQTIVDAKMHRANKATLAEAQVMYCKQLSQQSQELAHQQRIMCAKSKACFSEVIVTQCI